MHSFLNYYKKQKPVNIKYNVILFTGEYNPITRKEYERVVSFVKEHVNNNPYNFVDDADIGLLTPNESLSKSHTELEVDLTYDERQFIAGKLFGFKLFPIDFNELFNLTTTCQMEQVNEIVNNTAKFFKENFANSNILIVLRPGEGYIENNIDIVSNIFKVNGVNIGFFTYDDKFKYEDPIFKDVPIESKLLKAVCLMDLIRPSPLELKTFSYEYKVQEYLEYIKLIHFKVRGEKFNVAFKYLFPDVKLIERTNEEQEYNLNVILDLLKSMYDSKQIRN